MSLPDYPNKKFTINNLAAFMFTKGHFLSMKGFLLTWAPFALLVALIVFLCSLFSPV